MFNRLHRRRPRRDRISIRGLVLPKGASVKSHMVRPKTHTGIASSQISHNDDSSAIDGDVR